ncbi:MAG: MFS transporter [Candidatus Korobacteraceae bacterium]|jgi:ACS family glucarate transporter-like MFS transporter
MGVPIDVKPSVVEAAPSVPSVKRTNYRWMLAVFAMLMIFMNYVDRVNLAVAAPSIMKELHFTKVQLGFFQTVFFLSYALFQIPSGTLVEFFGHRRVVPISLVWWSLFTSMTATCRSFGTWVVVRALFGIGESPAYPGLNSAIFHWFPKRERGRAVGIMLLGSKIGPVCGIPAATMLMIHFGWRSVFWIFGGIGFFIAIAYYLMIRTYPHESRFVNQAELEHIADGRPLAAPADKKTLAPWSQFLRSVQFWCIGGQLGTANFVQYVFIAWLPVYLLEAHHFSLKAMGFAAAIPEFAFAVGVIICGLATDYVIGRKLADSKARAWFGGIGQLFCCFGLYLTAMSDGKAPTIFWLSVALASLGFSMNSTWTSASDLGGKFSGSVSAWTNFMGNLIGGMAPMVVAWVATGYGWKAAIMVTAVAGLVGATCWAFVRPHRPLKGSEQTVAGA